MKRLHRKLTLLAAVALLGLAGCASPGGTSYMDDAMVTARVKKAIYNDPALKVTDVSVTTEDGVVALSGMVKTRAERNKATEVARKVEGVKRVKNELKVGQ